MTCQVERSAGGGGDLVRIEVTCSECGAAVVFPLDKECDNRTVLCPYCPDGDNYLWTENEQNVDRQLVRALMLAHKSNPRVKLVVKMPGG